MNKEKSLINNRTG